MTRCGRDDAGAATVLVLVGCLVTAVAGAVVVGSAEATVARHRASAAADAAALAAGGADLATPTVACAAAREAAAADGGVLATCTLHDGVADVTVSVRPSGWLGGLGSARARARAGRFPAYRTHRH